MWEGIIIMTEQYKIFEAELTGTDRGNPYEDIWLKATFSNDSEALEVNGFYCGGGRYKIRFMPVLQTHSRSAVH